jgi:DNA-binding MarR family transcriptional regulator
VSAAVADLCEEASMSENPVVPAAETPAPEIDPGEAIEDLLVSAHRMAVSLGELSVFEEHNLSVAEWAILRSIRKRQDVPLKEVGGAAGVSRQRIRKLVSELQTKGLVTVGQTDSQDKRTRSLSPTPAAETMVAAVSLQMQGLIPTAGQSKLTRKLAGTARSVERLAKAMQRSMARRKTGRKKRERGGAHDDEGTGAASN